MFNSKVRAYVRRRVAARYAALLQAKQLVEEEDVKVKATLSAPWDQFSRKAYDEAMAHREAASALHTEMMDLYFRDAYEIRQLVTKDALGWKGDVVYLPC